MLRQTKPLARSRQEMAHLQAGFTGSSFGKACRLYRPPAFSVSSTWRPIIERIPRARVTNWHLQPPSGPSRQQRSRSIYLLQSNLLSRYKFIIRGAILRDANRRVAIIMGAISSWRLKIQDKRQMAVALLQKRMGSQSALPGLHHAVDQPRWQTLVK